MSDNTVWPAPINNHVLTIVTSSQMVDDVARFIARHKQGLQLEANPAQFEVTCELDENDELVRAFHQQFSCSFEVKQALADGFRVFVGELHQTSVFARIKLKTSAKLALAEEVAMLRRTHVVLTGQVQSQRDEIHRLKEQLARPKEQGGVQMILYCPECHERHIDEGHWATHLHHTHACQHCGMVWRPAVCPTTGVQFLNGFGPHAVSDQASHEDE